MHHKNLIKSSFAILLLLMLAALAIMPVAAQGPDDGDVEAQVVSFIAFLWNPAYTYVSRGDGTVTTKLDVQGAEDISGLTLAIGYDASVVSPVSVVEGDLLPGTRGVDYFMVVRTGGGALACGGDSSFTVEIAYLNAATSINGSGSLVDILWRSDPDAAVGDVGNICLNGATSLVVDNGGFPGPPLGNVLGNIEVEPATIFKFQIALEGGKNSGLALVAVPDNIFTDVTVNGVPCDGGGVDLLGFCAFNNGAVSPPYTVEMSRIGYLDALSVFTDPHDSGAVWLWAGDLNDDNVINILDMVLMASLLNQPTGPTTISQAADFTGPPLGGPGTPPGPDGVINIIDLVLVAKNFGLGGPTDGAPPPGANDFPF